MSSPAQINHAARSTDEADDTHPYPIPRTLPHQNGDASEQPHCGAERDRQHRGVVGEPLLHSGNVQYGYVLRRPSFHHTAGSRLTGRCRGFGGGRRSCLGRVISALLAISLLGAPAATAETVVCRFTDDRLVEISGMAVSRQHANVLWLHNDSSHGPYLYAVDANTCETIARIEVAGIEARDLEGMAVGVDDKDRPVIWLGDIGDNRDTWPFVWIHRIREPAVLVDQVVKARTYQVTYPGGPLNAEALLADPTSQKLWIVTKQLARGGLYALPDPPRKRNSAEYVREEGPLITDGAIAPSGQKYVLRDYVNATIYQGLPPGERVMRIELPLQVQGEAITWTADESALLITSERDDRLIRVAIDEPEPSAAPDADPAPLPVEIPDIETLSQEPASESAMVPIAVVAVIAVMVLGAAELLRRRGRQHR